jgi:hypothetical protein
MIPDQPVAPRVESAKMTALSVGCQSQKLAGRRTPRRPAAFRGSSLSPLSPPRRPPPSTPRRLPLFLPNFSAGPAGSYCALAQLAGVRPPPKIKDRSCCHGADAGSAGLKLRTGHADAHANGCATSPMITVRIRLSLAFISSFLQWHSPGSKLPGRRHFPCPGPLRLFPARPAAAQKLFPSRPPAAPC